MSLLESPVSSSPWLQALLLTSLRTTNIHLLLTSLRTVFMLWQESTKKGDVILSDIVCSVANIMGSKTDLIQVQLRSCDNIVLRYIIHVTFVRILIYYKSGNFHVKN